MIVKINTKTVSQLLPTELENLKQILIQLDSLTLKQNGGSVEIFPEKSVKNYHNFETLFREISKFQMESDIRNNFNVESKYGEKLNQNGYVKPNDTEMYISSVNRTYEQSRVGV